jgi:zinc-ribbon domain
MSEPEIARRCLSCGASVRERASFCPQCGQMIKRPQSDSEADPQTNAVEGPETQIIAAPELPTITPEVREASAVTQTDIVLPEELRPHSGPLVAETQPLITHTIQREPTVSEADTITQHQAEVAQPPVEHHLLDRVDRIRKVSSVVIDQAAYDPSLRFLLVAAVLFIIFVVLMILSKVIS